MSPGSSPLVRSAVPWPVWLLLGGAIAHLAVAIAPDSYSLFGPYLLVDAGMVLDWVQAMAPFLLAAAVVAAADRWPAGRRTMLIGAAALAVVAALRLVGDIWWALWEASDHRYDPGPPWLIGMFLVTGVAFVAAHLLLAGGLWTSRPRPATGRGRAVVLAVIALAGLAATGLGLWVAGQTLIGAQSDGRVYSAAVGVLVAAGFAALAALGFAAARAVPRRGGLPETLIALGAVVTLVATAWAWGFPSVTPPQAVTEEAFVWVFTLPRVSDVLGSMTMIAGFGLAALTIRRLHSAAHPAA